MHLPGNRIGGKCAPPPRRRFGQGYRERPGMKHKVRPIRENPGPPPIIDSSSYETGL